MAPTLFPRDTSEISSSAIIGIAVVGAVAVGLFVVLAVIYFRRRRRATHCTVVFETAMASQQSLEKGLTLTDMQALRTPIPLGRSVSRRNLTSSVVLPMPMPPIPAARPRPPKQTAAKSRPLSNTEVLARHEATGTTPRAFSALAATAISSEHSGAPSARPFSFALNAPSPGPLPDLTISRTTTPSHSGSVVSFSRASVVSTFIPRSSLRTSISSKSSTEPTNTSSEALKVHHVFTPLLPDELVLRRGERLGLVQAYDDGWYIVGRRAAWAPKATQYALGHATRKNTPDEVELGAVPAWVFQKGGSPQTRPMRSTSLGVTLVLDESERARDREEVISWSNF